VGIVLATGRHKGNRAIPPPTATPATQQFGANTGLLFNARLYPLPVIDAQLKALQHTGATLARSDAPWEATEPQPPRGGIHHYDWSFDDAVAGALAASGLTWLPIIDYSAPWARSIKTEDHSAPDPAEYAAYAAAVAARYGPDGSFWKANPNLTQHPVETYEIWNEPDNPIFWSPSPDAAAYARLYLRAHAAIHGVQPGALVLVGGLTHPASFLPALLAAAPAVRGQLDAVAVHTYGGTPFAVLADVRSARQVLDSLGLTGVPLYVTEFGWTTSPPGALDYLPARLRPTYIESTLAALGHADCGVSAVLLYAWVTPQRDPADPQDWFGIRPPSGAQSSDVSAFVQGLAAARSPGPAVRLCV
jgi:hypothetical protein